MNAQWVLRLSSFSITQRIQRAEIPAHPHKQGTRVSHLRRVVAGSGCGVNPFERNGQAYEWETGELHSAVVKQTRMGRVQHKQTGMEHNVAPCYLSSAEAQRHEWRLEHTPLWLQVCRV